MWAAQVPFLQLNVILMGEAYNNGHLTYDYFVCWICISFINLEIYLDSAKYAFNPKDVKLHTKVSSSNNSCSPSERDIKERIKRLSQVFANKVFSLQWSCVIVKDKSDSKLPTCFPNFLEVWDLLHVFIFAKTNASLPLSLFRSSFSNKLVQFLNNLCPVNSRTPLWRNSPAYP